jgi:CDI immunity protein
MNPHLDAYLALERIVLIPAYREDSFGPAISDDESLVVCPVTMPDHELGATAIRLLQNQRRRDFPMDFRSEDHRRRLAARRKLLCRAFGVKAMKDWLPEATSVSVSATGNELTIKPWRHAGKQDSWTGDAADPVETVPLSDPQQVGSALHRMLAIRLPPGH